MPSIQFNQQAQRGENYGYHWNTSQGQQTASNESQQTSQGDSRSVSEQDPGLLTRWDAAMSDARQSHDRLYRDYTQGYQDVLGRTANQADRVTAGYSRLSQDVIDRLRGSDEFRRQQIADAYAKQRGAASSSLTGRCLGNTTVRDSVDRGLVFDREKAYTQLAGEGAQREAGYQAQLGSQGLAAQAALQGQYGQLGGQYIAGMQGYLQNPLAWAPNRVVSTSQNRSQGTSGGRSQGTNSSYGQGEQWGLNQSYGYGMGLTGGGGGGGGYPSYGGGNNRGGGGGGGGGDWGDDYWSSQDWLDNYYGTHTYTGPPNTGEGSGVPIVPGPGGAVSPNPATGGGFVTIDAGGNVTSGTPGPGYVPPGNAQVFVSNPYAYTGQPGTVYYGSAGGGGSPFIPSAYPNASNYPSSLGYQGV